jgi:hypothetical protein
VRIEWIESVPSVRYQATKIAASITANTTVLSSSGTPRLSVSSSVTSVPNTLTKVTADQYRTGVYRFAANCAASTITRSRPVAIDVPVRPRLTLTLRKSAADSPTVVQSTLMIQK